MPAFKIASGDLTNTPLLRHVAAFGKPMFVSTGGGTLEDVERAVDAVLPLNEQLCVLQCTASYPCEVEELNLGVIETYRERFPDLVVGLSDHQSGIAMSLVGYMLGARVIEKHFTLNHAWKGSDHAFSLMPEGMRRLVRDLHRVPGCARRRREASARERGASAREDGEEARRDARLCRRDTFWRRATSWRSRRPTAACRRTSSSPSSAERLVRALAFEQAVVADDVEPVEQPVAAARSVTATLRDPARRVRLRRRLLGQPRVDERARRGERRLLPWRLGRAAPTRRGRRRVLRPHVGDERRRPRARAEDPHRVRPRDRGQAPGAARRARAAGRRARRDRLPRQRHQRRRVPGRRRDWPSSRPTPGPRSCRSQGSCSREQGVMAACGSSATRSGARSGRPRRHERSALRPRGSRRGRHRRDGAARPGVPRRSRGTRDARRELRHRRRRRPGRRPRVRASTSRTARRSSARSPSSSGSGVSRTSSSTTPRSTRLPTRRPRRSARSRSTRRRRSTR